MLGSFKMFRGTLTLFLFMGFSFYSVFSKGEIHSGYTNPVIPSLPTEGGVTAAGRYYGTGPVGGGISTVFGYPSNGLTNVSYYPSSSYLYSPTSYTNYSFGYWGNLFGNWGLCYKQPGLYSNYQYGPYNYGSSPTNWLNYFNSTYPSSSCYGFGITYNPCQKPYYGFWKQRNSYNQARVLKIAAF
jgi:hypothetical protein